MDLLRFSPSHSPPSESARLPFLVWTMSGPPPSRCRPPPDPPPCGRFHGFSLQLQPSSPASSSMKQLSSPMAPGVTASLLRLPSPRLRLRPPPDPPPCSSVPVPFECLLPPEPPDSPDTSLQLAIHLTRVGVGVGSLTLPFILICENLQLRESSFFQSDEKHAARRYPTSLFSPQTPFSYTPTGICSPIPSLLDVDDLWIYLCSVNTLWIQHGNVGIRSFYWNSTLCYSSNLVKSLSQGAIRGVVWSSLPNLTQPCFPISAISSHPIDPSVSCSLWSRIIMELEMESPSTELCNLGLELGSYLFGAVTGVDPQSSSQNHHKPLASSSAKTVVRLLLKWSFSKREDCSPVVFSLRKRLLKFPHAQGHERSFPHVLLLLGDKTTTKSLLYGAVYISAEDQDVIETVYSAGMSDISKNRWLRHGNVGSQSLFLTSAIASPSNTVKLINLYAVMKVACPSLPGLKHPPLAITIHVQQLSGSLTSTHVHVRLTQSLARSQSLLEACSPAALLQKVNQTSS